jgi:uncharacterized phage protein (TIGR01671 family)
MREIKFRAWHRKRKEWHYYDLHGLAGMAYPQIVGSEQIKVSMLDYQNWCEYTGLHDKQGKEIYEGDVVTGIAPIHWGGRATVKWLGSGFRYDFRHKDNPSQMHMSIDITQERHVAYSCRILENDIEIIGNIYENPDLSRNKHIDFLGWL